MYYLHQFQLIFLLALVSDDHGRRHDQTNNNKNKNVIHLNIIRMEENHRYRCSYCYDNN